MLKVELEKLLKVRVISKSKLMTNILIKNKDKIFLKTLID